MRYCSLCGKQLGTFTRKHEHKKDDNKIETYCHDCHIRKKKEIIEKKNREMYELKKADAQLKLERKFAAKIIQAVNSNGPTLESFFNHTFYRGFNKKAGVGVEIRDYISKDGIFTINVLGNYSYTLYDRRYTLEHRMERKRFNFECCLGDIIITLSKENQIYEYKKITVIFWGEKYDMLGHSTWIRYASFTLVPDTLKKMVLANLFNFQVIQVFDHHIGDFPNGLG